jgi:hypothetical protein
VWQERQALIDDVRRISEELLHVAEDAGVRYPAEPAEETTPLPELPPLPEESAPPSAATGGPDDDTRPQPAPGSRDAEIESPPPRPGEAADQPPLPGSAVDDEPDLPPPPPPASASA